MKLACRELCKRFPGRDGAVQALDGVELEVGESELVSIVGPSGCGKSTLLGILAGLLEPSSGTVELDGAPCTGLLGRLAHMPQRDLLMPWRTVLDNVALARELSGEGRAHARAAALAQFERFGLAGFERHRPATLSGGMRQRAALLRTFLTGREVMLLDEPLGALDALTRQAMQSWLLEVWQQDRKTIVLVTHDVEEAIFLSDRVYVMSARPGRMLLELEVALPRPRAPELITAPEFVGLKQALLEPLRAQC